MSPGYCLSSRTYRSTARLFVGSILLLLGALYPRFIDCFTHHSSPHAFRRNGSDRFGLYNNHLEINSNSSPLSLHPIASRFPQVGVYRYERRFARSPRRNDDDDETYDSNDFSDTSISGPSSPRLGLSRLPRLRVSATYSLIAVNVFMFLLTSIYPRMYRSLMKINGRIFHYGESYRLASSIFLHADVYHLLMNSVSLRNIGPHAERVFGSGRFVAIYLGAGILANLMTYLIGVSPYSLGASGATFGLLGALAMFYYANRKVLGRNSETGKCLLIDSWFPFSYADAPFVPVWIVLSSIKSNLILNMVMGMSQRNIDHWCHMGGFLGGALLTGILVPRIEPRIRRTSNYANTYNSRYAGLRRGLNPVKRVNGGNGKERSRNGTEYGYGLYLRRLLRLFGIRQQRQTPAETNLWEY